jgi:hypothetical protein
LYQYRNINPINQSTLGVTTAFSPIALAERKWIAWLRRWKRLRLPGVTPSAVAEKMKMLNPKCLAVFLNGGFLKLGYPKIDGSEWKILLKLMIWEYPISRNTQISANEKHFYYLALIYYHYYLLQYYTETIYIYTQFWYKEERYG